MGVYPYSPAGRISRNESPVSAARASEETPCTGAGCGSHVIEPTWKPGRFSTGDGNDVGIV